MIDRYKKNGGFVQLLQVLETCAPLKRQRLINIIREETPAWADAIEKKSINFNRIISWPDYVALEYLVYVTHLSFVIALKGIAEETCTAFIKKLSYQEQRKIGTLISEISPGPSEISASALKITGEIRQLIIDGILKVETFDKELSIPNNFESILIKQDSAQNNEAAQKIMTHKEPHPPVANETAATALAASSAARAPDKATAPGIKLVKPLNDTSFSNQQPSGKADDCCNHSKPKESHSSASSSGPSGKPDDPIKPEKAASPTFSLASENRPEVLKTKIVELTQQLSLLLRQNKELKEELEKHKKAA